MIVLFCDICGADGREGVVLRFQKIRKSHLDPVFFDKTLPPVQCNVTEIIDLCADCREAIEDYMTELANGWIDPIDQTERMYALARGWDAWLPADRQPA